MDNSILQDVKKYIGINGSYDPYFDSQILLCINSVMMTLRQIGIGTGEGFIVHDDSETWNDALGGNTFSDISAFPLYVCMRVKLMFDPPSAQSVLQAFKDTISELEWRLNVQVDPEDTFL